ncbi:MAG TPA: GNAT family N-acetyltransferase [Anaeromyxobacter sp.]
MHALRPASSPADWDLARALFREYEREIDAACCFDGFEAELAALELRYAAPEGRLLLAFADGEPAGCAALRRIADGVAEGRRLWLRPAYRGRGLGGALVLALLDEARHAGFRTFRLETLPGKMSAAAALHRQLGFREIAPYVRRPVPGALYMELALVPG